MSETVLIEAPVKLREVKDERVYRYSYKLTVDTVAALIQKGFSQADISRLLNVSESAVSQFIGRHPEIEALIDNTDQMLAIRFKRHAIGYLDSIKASDIEKASLLQRVTASGIATDKYRLLSGQSTENVSMKVSPLEADALESIAQEAARRVIQAQDVVIEPYDNDNNEVKTEESE
jgi:hypothetical protein